MKKPPDSNPEFSREREFTAVLEDLRSQFRVFGEALEDVRNQLDWMKESMNKTAEKIDRIEIRIFNIESTFATKRDLEVFARLFNARLTVLESKS